MVGVYLGVAITLAKGGNYRNQLVRMTGVTHHHVKIRVCA